MKSLFRFEFFGFALAAALAGCSVPKMDISTATGRQAILDQTNLDLTHGDCGDAINLIEPLYNSQYTNNEVRLIRASAQGCYAGVSYFSLLTDLTNSNLVAGQFWVTLTKLFPYSDLAGLQSGWYAADALMAVLNGGVQVATNYQVNAGTYNVGSDIVTDRTADANSYLVLTSMAVIGRSQYRNGAPDANYDKTQNLPWTSAAAMTEEGCAYAGAIVNMVDGLEAIISETSGSVNTVLSEIDTELKSVVTAACETGCQACGMPAGTCTPSGSFCPLALRDRTTCSPVNTNQSACAAAGIVSAINSGPASWP